MRLKFKLIGEEKLIAYLGKVEKQMKPNIRAALRDSVNHLQQEVKNKFGRYNKDWAKLKTATVIAKYKRRMRRGSGVSTIRFSGTISGVANAITEDPLVLFGTLKNSIEKKVTSVGGNFTGIVYTDAPHAAVHEYGYAPKNIPARSYARLTLWEEQDYIIRIVNNRIARLI
jgi:phage gpG-like protein